VLLVLGEPGTIDVAPWVGDGTDRGVREALTTWFGPPTVTLQK
jgi:hypothetical protein